MARRLTSVYPQTSPSAPPPAYVVHVGNVIALFRAGGLVAGKEKRVRIPPKDAFERSRIRYQASRVRVRYLYNETPNRAFFDHRALLRINKLRPFNIEPQSKSRPANSLAPVTSAVSSSRPLVHWNSVNLSACQSLPPAWTADSTTPRVSRCPPAVQTCSCPGPSISVGARIRLMRS